MSNQTTPEAEILFRSGATVTTAAQLWVQERIGLSTPVSAQIYGALESGDPTAKIQQAIDYAYANGRSVSLPGNKTYVLTTALNLWTGVDLIAEPGAILKRGWGLVGNTATGGYTGNRFMLYAYGDNTIKGLSVNGSSDTIAVSVSGVNANAIGPMDVTGVVDQTQYGDIGIRTGPYNYGPSGNTALPESNITGQGKPGTSCVRILDCDFDLACGSSIKNHEDGARGVIIRGCRFGRYNDHSVYFAGWPSLSGLDTPSLDLLVTNNIFSSISDTASGNGCLKIRNYASRAVFQSNIINARNDHALILDVGDSFGGNGAIDAVFSNNDVTCRDFAYCSSTATSGSRVVVQSNVIKLVRNNGFLWREGGVSSTYMAGLVSFRHNKCLNATGTQVLLQANGNTSITDPTHWDITGNVFDGRFTIVPYGNLELDVSGNTAINRVYPDTYNDSFVSGSVINNNRPAATTIWTIANNNLSNYAVLLADISDTSGLGGLQLIQSANINLRNNTVVGHPTRNWLTDIRGTAAGAYAGANRIYESGNKAALLLSGVTTLPLAAYVGDGNLRAGPVIGTTGRFSGTLGVNGVTPTDAFDSGGNIGLSGSVSRSINLRAGNAGSTLAFEFPELTTLAGQFRFFRSTSTTGSASNGIQIFRGDGTGSLQSFIGANGDSYTNALAGNFGVGNAAPSEKLHTTGNIRASGFIRTDAKTVADLTAAGTAGNGARSYVINATLAYSTLNIGAALVGGGANHTPCIVVNGAWVIG